MRTLAEHNDNFSDFLSTASHIKDINGTLIFFLIMPFFSLLSLNIILIIFFGIIIEENLLIMSIFGSSFFIFFVYKSGIYKYYNKKNIDKIKKTGLDVTKFYKLFFINNKKLSQIKDRTINSDKNVIDFLNKHGVFLHQYDLKNKEDLESLYVDFLKYFLVKKITTAKELFSFILSVNNNELLFKKINKASFIVDSFNNYIKNSLKEEFLSSQQLLVEFIENNVESEINNESLSCIVELIENKRNECSKNNDSEEMIIKKSLLNKLRNGSKGKDFISSKVKYI